MAKKVKTSSEYQFYPFDDIRDIKKVRRPSVKREITLSNQVQEMMILTEDGQLNEKTKEFTQQQKRVIEVGRKAKERMMKGHAKLVVSVAKKYQSEDFDLVDLFQEGILGLEKAVEKYDPKRGYEFSTYAFWWIRQSMKRAIASQSRTKISRLKKGAKVKNSPSKTIGISKKATEIKNLFSENTIG